MGDGVRNQIADRPQHQRPIQRGGDGLCTTSCNQGYPAVRCCGLVVFAHRAQQFTHVHRLPVQVGQRALRAGEEQEVADQIGQPDGFFQRRLQHIAVFLDRARTSQSDLGFAADIVDRRSQVVRDIGCKPGDLLKGLFQTNQHLVEGFGQRGQFRGIAFRPNPFAQIGRCDSPRSCGNLFDGTNRRGVRSGIPPGGREPRWPAGWPRTRIDSAAAILLPEQRQWRFQSYRCELAQRPPPRRRSSTRKACPFLPVMETKCSGRPRVRLANCARSSCSVMPGVVRTGTPCSSRRRM